MFACACVCVVKTCVLPNCLLLTLIHHKSFLSLNRIHVDYINEVLNETQDDDDDVKKNLPDDWEEGLTFTAKSSRKYQLHFILSCSYFAN